MIQISILPRRVSRFALFCLSIMVVIDHSQSFSSVVLTSADGNSSSESPKLLSGILFDIDGTLVNSDPVHFQIFQELLLQQEGFNDGQPIDEAFFRSKIAGRQNALIMEDLFPHWSLERKEKWAQDKEAYFRKLAGEGGGLMQRKMPGLDRLTQWIDQVGLQRAAVTNAPRLNAEAMLQGIGLADYFKVLVIGDECERAKPDPCPYLTACKRLHNLNPENCIVFEDSPSGARAGVAAGATVVGILSGQTEATLLDAGCAFVIQDFEDSLLWDYLSRAKVHSSISVE